MIVISTITGIIITSMCMLLLYILGAESYKYVPGAVNRHPVLHTLNYSGNNLGNDDDDDDDDDDHHGDDDDYDDDK